MLSKSIIATGKYLDLNYSTGTLDPSDDYPTNLDYPTGLPHSNLIQHIENFPCVSPSEFISN